MRLLVFDPSSTRIGWIVWDGENAEAHATITLTGECVSRLPIVEIAIADLLTRYKPDAVALEAPAFSRQRMVEQAMVRGVILLVVKRMGYLHTEVAPNTAKKALTANGRADKHEMIACAALHLTSVPQWSTVSRKGTVYCVDSRDGSTLFDEHVADSLAVAIAAFPRFEMEGVAV
jgi:Holliday junction resolvasome RuvABC endonuclease subunit